MSGEQEKGGPKRTRRSGTETGARIMWLLEYGELDQPSATVLASEMGMEESYVRRVCRALTKADLLTSREVPQRGTPPVKVYAVVKPVSE